MTLELNEEIVQRLIGEDPRLRQIDLSIRIETELQSSIAIKYLIDSARREAEDAIAAWMADPSPTSEESLAIHRRAFLYTYITNTLTSFVNRGRVMEASLREEDAFNG